MKAMIISCLEPQHLNNCLEALKMWIPVEDIYVINNGNTNDRVQRITQAAEEASVNVIRPEYVERKKSTKVFIHRITKEFAEKFPEEIILKIDEDNILVSSIDKFSFEPGTLFFPVSTINNYTTRVFLKKFWPNLDERLKDCTWMWHKPEPAELKKVLFDAIYGSDPKDLIEFTEQQSIREYITQSNFRSFALMSERGISTHAVAFHARDYIDNYGDDEENQEIWAFRVLQEGKIRYVIDRSIFCHHINYHSIRDLVKGNPELVNTFHGRIFSYYKIKSSHRSSRAQVCVTIGWYSDKEGGHRGDRDLAPQLFEPGYLTEVLIPRIKKQLDPKVILLYVSECEIPPDPLPEGVEIIHGLRPAKRNTASHRKSPYNPGGAHDWGATMMAGAMYAYINDLDLIFYEQDCLVHNFTKILRWAQGKPLVYGYGESASYKEGWAEPSLTFASREFLPEMMSRLIKGRWHIWNNGFLRFKHPEKYFHNTFADVAEYWPFGYGMKRPIDYSQEMYFAQRFVEKDYLEFLKNSPT